MDDNLTDSCCKMLSMAELIVNVHFSCSAGMHTIQFFTSRFYKSRYRDKSMLCYLSSSSQCWSVYCHTSSLST